MNDREKIRRAFKKLQDGKIQTFAAIVEEVDTEKSICTVSYSGRKIIRVRLKSVIGETSSGLVIIPTVGSSVLITIINNSYESTFITAYSQIDGLYFRNEAGYTFNISEADIKAVVGDSSFIMEEDKITFNDGSLNGLVKIDKLKEELDKNSQILQALLTILTGSPIPEPGNGSPSALQTALSGALAGKQPGQWNDIENDKIVHG